MEFSDKTRKGLAAITLGTIGYTFGTSLDSETMRHAMDYLTQPEFTERLMPYAAVIKFAGASATLAGVMGMLYNMIVGEPKSEDKKQPAPRPAPQPPSRSY